MRVLPVARRIDVGEINGKRFLCIASCGFDSDANRIANETKVVSGALVYAYAALKALWQWKPARFTVTVDGDETVVTGYSAVVANSNWSSKQRARSAALGNDSGVTAYSWPPSRALSSFMSMMLLSSPARARCRSRQ